MTTEAFSQTTARLIYYIISSLDGVLGRTHLQKLLFLSDLISTKRVKEQITGFQYVRYHHGPFSNTVEEYITKLEQKGFITSKEFAFVSDPKTKYFRYFIKKHAPIKEKLLSEIGPEKLLILDEVISSYGNMSLQNVLDIVYDMQLIKNSKLNDALPLDMAKDSIEERDEETELIDF